MPPNPYRRQPNINDMMYPKGSKQPRQVWAAVMNVPQPSSGAAVTPTPTATLPPTPTPSPTTTLTSTPTTTPTPSPTTTLTSTPTQTPTTTTTLTSTPTPTPTKLPLDSDAVTYLNSVVTAGGSVTSTMSAATNSLFTSLKSAGLYTKLFAFYPQIGGTASSNGKNAKNNATYNLTWSGGFTYTTTGSTGNGTNAYANGNFRTDEFITSPTSYHILAYQNSSNTPTGSEEHIMGSLTVDGYLQLANNVTALSGNYVYRAGDISALGSFASSGRTGLFMVNKSSTLADFWKNGVKVQTIDSGVGKAYTSDPLYLWAVFYLGTPYTGSYANQTYSFLSMGQGLTTGEVTSLTSIINTFQTSLGRNTF